MKQLTLQLSRREYSALLWALEWKLRDAKPDAHAGYDVDLIGLTLRLAQAGAKNRLYMGLDLMDSPFVLRELQRALREAAQVPGLSGRVQELQQQVKALTAKPARLKKRAARSSPKATAAVSGTAAPGAARSSPTGRAPRAAPAATTVPGPSTSPAAASSSPDALGS